jgi:large subunit ribosomal protein L4
MNLKRDQVSKIDLDPEVFDVPMKEHLLHEVILMQQARYRQGTASTKTRGQVRGGGKKPWRQKGTGRARAGSIRSPLWVGGGVVFGPRPREYKNRLPKKVRKAALKLALTQKRREGKILVLDEFKIGQIKTKKLKEILDDMEINNVLIVIPEKDENLELSARNLKKVKVLQAQGLNVRDIIIHDQMLITKEALDKVQETLA